MVNSALRLSLLLVLIGVAVGQAPSVRPKTILIGTVCDTNHAAIVNARVVARDATGQDYATTTTDKGAFLIELPVGIYKIEATAEGFCPKRKRDVEPVSDIVDLVLTVRDQKRGCKHESMLNDKKTGPSPRIAE